MRLRPMIEYGFIAFNGKAWRNDQVDSYNAIQARINSFLLDGKPVSEGLLDESHRAFCLYSER